MISMSYGQEAIGELRWLKPSVISNIKKGQCKAMLIRNRRKASDLLESHDAR